MKLHIYRCFKCGSSGNQLDLYATVTGLGLFEATVAFCEQLHREIPWIVERNISPARTPNRFIPDQSCSHEIVASPPGELADPRVVEQFTPQPLRWCPLVSQSGALSGCKRRGGRRLRRFPQGTKVSVSKSELLVAEQVEHTISSADICSAKPPAVPEAVKRHENRRKAVFCRDFTNRPQNP